MYDRIKEYLTRFTNQLINYPELGEVFAITGCRWSIDEYSILLKNKSKEILNSIPQKYVRSMNLFVICGTIIYTADILIARDNPHKKILTPKMIAKATNIHEVSIKLSYSNIFRPLFTDKLDLINAECVNSKEKINKILVNNLKIFKEKIKVFFSNGFGSYISDRKLRECLKYDICRAMRNRRIPREQTFLKLKKVLSSKLTGVKKEQALIHLSVLKDNLKELRKQNIMYGTIARELSAVDHSKFRKLHCMFLRLQEIYLNQDNFSNSITDKNKLIYKLIVSNNLLRGISQVQTYPERLYFKSSLCKFLKNKGDCKTILTIPGLGVKLRNLDKRKREIILNKSIFNKYFKDDYLEFCKALIPISNGLIPNEIILNFQKDNILILMKKIIKLTEDFGTLVVHAYNIMKDGLGTRMARGGHGYNPFYGESDLPKIKWGKMIQWYFKFDKDDFSDFDQNFARLIGGLLIEGFVIIIRKGADVGNSQEILCAFNIFHGALSLEEIDIIERKCDSNHYHAPPVITQIDEKISSEIDSILKSFMLIGYMSSDYDFKNWHRQFTECIKFN